MDAPHAAHLVHIRGYTCIYQSMCFRSDGRISEQFYSDPTFFVAHKPPLHSQTSRASTCTSTGDPDADSAYAPSDSIASSSLLNLATNQSSSSVTSKELVFYALCAFIILLANLASVYKSPSLSFLVLHSNWIFVH